MSTTGVALLWLRNSFASASTSRSPTPWARARSEERWMTGPSAIGSDNGNPSSIKSATAATSAWRIATVRCGVGSPAVTNGMSAGRPRARNFSNTAAIRLTAERSKDDSGGFRHSVHVLVAASGQIHEEGLVFRHRGRDLHRVGERMTRFERRNDALQPAERVKGFQRFCVRHRDILSAAGILEPRVLRSHARVIEAGGDRVRRLNLAVAILHEVGAVAVQNARRARAEGSRVLTRLEPET